MARREAWAIAASLLACLALAGFLAAPRLLAEAPRDPKTLCRKSGRLGHTLILIDKSDPWSPVQAARLKRLVKQIGEDLPAERQLSIYVFNDVFEPNFPPLLSLCNPGRKVSDWIGNPRRDYRRWREQFGRPLDEALAALAQPGRGAHSPIVEAVADVTSRPENRPDAYGLSLVLVSDMIQNSAGSSLLGAAAKREPERLSRLIAKSWTGAGWRLSVHQLQGVYEPQRLEQAAALWQAALRAAGREAGWQRL